MRWLHALRERLSAWGRPGARDRDLDAEIAHHLDLEVDRHRRAGLAPADASRRALERFGDPIAVIESTRAARRRPGLGGTVQDVRYAIRTLIKQRGFSAMALATLALGIGATTAAFAVVNAVLLRPLPYRDADRLVFLREMTATHSLNPPSHPNVLDWRSRAQSFDGVASAMFPSASTVRASASSDPLRVTVMGVSRGFFHTLGVALEQGREFSDAENALGGAPVVVVSHEFWRTQMAGRVPLGEITVSGSAKVVVGVLPPEFTFMTPASVYVPHEQMPGTCRTCRNYMVVARLKPGITIDRARAEMSALTAAMRGQYGTDITAVDVDVQDLREYSVGDYRTLLLIVLGAAALVLVMACTNLLSAQLARGWAREGEVLVRTALGASRGRVIRQLVIENAVLVLVGATAGLALAAGLTRLIAIIGADQLPRLDELSIDMRIAGFALAVSFVTLVAVGLYPALRLSRVDAPAALRSTRGTGVAIHASAWRVLLGFEIALALALSIGSALLVRTIGNIMSADPGFDARHVLTASITPGARDAARLEDARVDLAALPSVDGVAYTTRLPLSWGANSGPVRRRTDPPGPNWPAFAGFRMVSPGYFDVIKQPVLQGRAFSAADGEHGEPVAIITPGVAETLWPGQSPIGQTISTNYLWDEWLTVVGVVAEASIWSQPKGSQNEIFVPYAQHLHALPGQSQVVAMIRTASAPAALTEPVRQSLHRVLPDSPALIRPMEARIEQSAASRRFVMVALTAFAVVALVLAVIGIYGVMWYMVATRSREIGFASRSAPRPGRCVAACSAAPSR
ncbi:MAG TPA: ABC transporter permease, partial [Vicinamibacterales bacterium]|nr:ABC transporter permease [Vicinamibacterales bacterium]